MRVKTAVRVWCVMFVCQSLTAFGEGALRVTTEQGVFVGQREEGLAVFRGMPYAEPPVGDGTHEVAGRLSQARKMASEVKK